MAQLTAIHGHQITEKDISIFKESDFNILVITGDNDLVCDLAISILLGGAYSFRRWYHTNIHYLLNLCWIIKQNSLLYLGRDTEY